MTITRVILVRHGQSNYNAEKRYQGSSDDSILTNLGLTQARQVGQILANEPIDAVYTSPLRRTQQTATEIVNQLLPNSALPIIQHEALREIDLPDWEGLTFTHVQKEFPEAYQTWIEQPQLFQLQTSELQPLDKSKTSPIALLSKPTFPVQDLYDRSRQFWQMLLPRQVGKTILIVSHGGTIRALMSTALGIPIEQFHHLQQSNAGITRLEFRHSDIPSQEPIATLQSMNQTHHLHEVLPKPKHGKQGLRLILLPTEYLNDQCNKTIANLLQSTSISFSLSSPESSTEHAKNILIHHPKTLQFEVSREHFLIQWQMMISNQHDRLRQHDPKTPMNALIIAPKLSLQILISQALRLNVESSIGLLPEHFSSLFYPAKFNHPVLQSLNQGLNALV
jgi:phosphoserine phosphatase